MHLCMPLISYDYIHRFYMAKRQGIKISPRNNAFRKEYLHNLVALYRIYCAILCYTCLVLIWIYILSSLFVFAILRMQIFLSFWTQAMFWDHWYCYGTGLGNNLVVIMLVYVAVLMKSQWHIYLLLCGIQNMFATISVAGHHRVKEKFRFLLASSYKSTVHCESLIKSSADRSHIWLHGSAKSLPVFKGNQQNIT